ncbi:MAG: rRNA methyltransferase [Treponema sp.]|jgi:hypothetical protein|nr:rRNA methyltransferase [Treponema sp.]
MRLFPPLETEIRRTLEDVPELIDRVFPLPRRFRAGLPKDVKELSLLLTCSRGERGESYLGKPSLLSAYLRYFLPWNLYRLCRLLPSLSLSLGDGDAITDLGCGPLTMPLALWVSRPDLRTLSLEFRCLDRTGLVLDAGKKLFYALAGDASPWGIKIIRASLDAPVKGPKAALVSAVNVFNELFRDLPYTDREGLSSGAAKSAGILLNLVSESGSILVVEPGIPRSGEFIALLRDAFLAYRYAPRLPCPHSGTCPFPGGKAKWCHFAFETQDAPPALLKLSAAAGLPKERATAGFLLAGPQDKEASKEASLPARIISDPFPVSAGKRRSGETFVYGRYACSVQGMILLTGTRGLIEKQESGRLLRLDCKPPLRRDPKSKALIVELGSGKKG